MNGHPPNIVDTNQATEHLKNILNVGKADTAAITPVSVMEPQGETYDHGSTFQRVDLNGNEGTVSIYGSDVSVYRNSMRHTQQYGTCNSIMIHNVVDYAWEHKYHLGCLVSVHLSRNFIAYTLKGPSHSSYVRVLKQTTSNHVLLKGFKGSVKDISFAHSMSRVLLGCIDEVGDLHINEILDEEPCLKCRLYLHIIRPINTPASNYHRLVWCPYVPDDTEGSDADQDERLVSLLLATHDEKAEIWNIDAVVKEYHKNEMAIETVQTGMKLICEHKGPITTAAFSPDAVALATASLDGEVKFFSINAMDLEGPPKCVHVWVPHDGKPISSLFFLDNHKLCSPDIQFWKFAVTGANHNEELKIWSCKTWTCLQTIRMVPYDIDGSPQYLKAEIDLSGSYLFLSDLNAMMFYIFKIYQDISPSRAAVCSLTEYSVQLPVLSFAILDVCPRKSKLSFHDKNSSDGDIEGEDDEDDDHEEDKDDADEATGKEISYHVKLYWINTKSFQFCKIHYIPKSVSPLHLLESLSSSQDSFAFRDGLSDMSSEVPEQTNPNNYDVDLNSNKSLQTPSNISSVLSPSSVSLPSATVSSLNTHRSPNYQECDEVLLTPKDFAMSSPHSSSLQSLNTSNSFKLTGIQETSDLSVNMVSGEDLAMVPPEQSVQPRRKSSQHSSTSSPSREVAEILSPNQILDHDNEMLSPKPKEPIMLSSQLDDHSNVICSSPVPQDFLGDSWPRAPNPPQEYKVSVSSGSDGEIVRQHLSLKQESAMHVLSSDAEITSEITLQNEAMPTSMMQRLERSMEALSLKLSSITEALHCQSQAIQFIQTEISQLQQDNQFMRKNVQLFNGVEETIANKIERIVSDSSVSKYSRFENLLIKYGEEQKQRLDQQVNVISQFFEQQMIGLPQSLTSGFGKQLDKTVKQEMQSIVMPHMTKCLEALIENFQGEVLQKLNSTDSALKECLGKHLRSKAFGENLAQASANLLQQSIQIACKEVFQNHVVGSLDKCCQLYFSQLNEVFTQGVQEYIEKLEKHQQLILANCEATTTRFQEMTQRLVADTQNILHSERTQTDAAIANRQHEILLSKVKQTVQEAVQRAVAENASSIAAVVRSQASTPAPQNEATASPQQLLHLAKQGQINEAFQKALCAVDVKLVLFLCENVSVDQAFGPDAAPLAQHVLLSLISQLSGDLSEKTEIKVRYIEDAITSLDKDDPVTKEHLGRVANTLEQRALAFLKQNPNHRMTRNVKRILMSINSFDLDK